MKRQREVAIASLRWRSLFCRKFYNFWCLIPLQVGADPAKASEGERSLTIMLGRRAQSPIDWTPWLAMPLVFSLPAALLRPKASCTCLSTVTFLLYPHAKGDIPTQRINMVAWHRFPVCCSQLLYLLRINAPC